MRATLKLVGAASALSAALAGSWPAAAADAEPGGYAVSGARQSRGKYPWLTMEAVRAKLAARFAGQVPPADSGRLVILNVDFRATGGGRGMLRKLDPADLQVQWAFADGTRGSAPVLGTHLGKDLITLVGSPGFYTLMQPDTYEVFAIVPKAAPALDLARRQPDGSFKTVKANVKLSPAK